MTSTRIATGRLPRFRIGVRRQCGAKLARQFIQAVIASVEPRDQTALACAASRNFLYDW